MIKKEWLNKILNFILPILIIVNCIFKFNGFFYFVFAFLAYGIINRINNKNNLLWLFLWWYLLVLVNNNMDIIYFSLIMGLLGNFIGYLVTKDNDTKYEVTEISKKAKKISFLFPFGIFFVTELLYHTCNLNQYYSFSINSLLLNLIIIYLVWSVLLFILNSTFRANTVLLIVSILYFVINQLKIFFTGEAISASDILMVSQAGEVFDIIKNGFWESLWNYRKLLILVVINAIFVIKLFKTFDFGKLNKKLRLSSVIAIILLAILLFPNESGNNLIKKLSFNDKSITRMSSLNDQYGAYRILGGLYFNYLSTIDYSESLNNEEDLAKIYQKTKKEEKTADFKKPNIIVMFTEAFWDITKQQTIQFSNDPLAEYHELKKKGVVISSLSPTYGGRSANTEFEFITGGALGYYPIGPIAYEKFYQKKESVNNPSILTELMNNGYKTEILNASSSKLYKCQNVYDKMKVNKTRHLYDEFKKNVKDSYLVDNLIERFNNKEKDEKLFYMTISMESHMPYTINNYKKYDFEITSTMNGGLKNAVKAYTQSIRSASLQLKRMYDYIQTLDEDTILIFFGDHLPIVHTLSANMYNEINEFNTSDKLSNIYRKYNTETLIFSNYDIKYNDLKEMSMNLIFTTIINNMDIEISDYYKWLYSTRKDLPAVNSFVAKDINGKIYDTNDLPASLQTTYNLRKKVQNYLFK